MYRVSTVCTYDLFLREMRAVMVTAKVAAD